MRVDPHGRSVTNACSSRNQPDRYSRPISAGLNNKEETHGKDQGSESR